MNIIHICVIWLLLLGWALFKLLCMAESPNRQLPIAGLQVVNADPPIDEILPFVDEVRQTVAWLKCGELSGICNINAELL